MPFESSSQIKGLRFPFKVSVKSGRTEVTTEAAQIESGLRMLIVTEKGSRPMLRDYGLGLKIILQEPNDELLQNLFRRLAFEEISRWEPRVIINNIYFKVDKENLHIYLEYRLAETGQDIVSDFSFPIT